MLHHLRARRQREKIVVTYTPRPDGGLRASCSAVPGLVLSSLDHDALREDVITALEVILGERDGHPVKVTLSRYDGEERGASGRNFRYTVVAA